MLHIYINTESSYWAGPSAKCAFRGRKQPDVLQEQIVLFRQKLVLDCVKDQTEEPIKGHDQNSERPIKERAMTSAHRELEVSKVNFTVSLRWATKRACVCFQNQLNGMIINSLLTLWKVKKKKKTWLGSWLICIVPPYRQGPHRANISRIWERPWRGKLKLRVHS